MPSRRDELLSSLLRSTLEQLGSLRDVVARSSEAGRARLDLTLLRRERAKLLQAVGEQVVAQVAAGQMKVPGEVAEVLERVAEIDRRIGDQEKRTVASEADAYHAAASAAKNVVGTAQERRSAQPSAAQRPPNVSPDLDEEEAAADATGEGPEGPAEPARGKRKRPGK